METERSTATVIVLTGTKRNWPLALAVALMVFGISICGFAIGVLVVHPAVRGNLPVDGWRVAMGLGSLLGLSTTVLAVLWAAVAVPETPVVKPAAPAVPVRVPAPVAARPRVRKSA